MSFILKQYKVYIKPILPTVTLYRNKLNVLSFVYCYIRVSIVLFVRKINSLPN